MERWKQRRVERWTNERKELRDGETEGVSEGNSGKKVVSAERLKEGTHK